MQTINIHAAKTNLSQLIEKVVAGEKVTICRNGEPMVDLVPHRKPDQAPRQFGQWKGKIIYDEDAFDAADAEIEALFEESELFPSDRP